METKRMTFLEAMKALSEGKNVRCTNWTIGNYIKFEEGEVLLPNNKQCCLIQANGKWEIYEEPKKKKLYAFRYRSGTISFYDKEEDEGNSCYKRAPEYDLEFDV